MLPAKGICLPLPLDLHLPVPSPVTHTLFALMPPLPFAPTSSGWDLGARQDDRRRRGETPPHLRRPTTGMSCQFRQPTYLPLSSTNTHVSRGFQMRRSRPHIRRASSFSRRRRPLWRVATYSGRTLRAPVKAPTVPLTSRHLRDHTWDRSHAQCSQIKVASLRQARETMPVFHNPGCLPPAAHLSMPTNLLRAHQSSVGTGAVHCGQPRD